MRSDCYDYGQSTGEPPPPLTDQEVTWTQRSTELELGMVDADDETGVAKITVTVPADAAPGEAEITVGRAIPAQLTVVPRE